jgi:hypothetical protein
MDLPERFMKLIWQRRLFTVAGLTTTDGRPIVILSPGKPNDDVGPDFTGARIRIGTITYQGDVELHRTARDWRIHGHQNDPHYNSVILHVVLADETLAPPAVTAAHRQLPLLVLHPFLDPATRPSLMASLSDVSDGPGPGLACHAHQRTAPASIILRWLEHLAEARIELKIRRFEARLRELIVDRNHGVEEPYPRYYGNPNDIPRPRHTYTQRDAASPRLWDQLLYEGLLEGLGYAKNEAPFAALARSVPLATLQSQGLTDTPAVMALLFGTAGLLPSTRKVVDKESRAYLLRLRRQWRDLRPMVKGPLLHEGDWRFFRLRPGNFPTVRLAAFSRLLPRLFGEDAFRGLVTLFKSETLSTGDRLRALASRFTDTPDAFWLHHYRFSGAARAPVAGMGGSRVTDLFVNVVLPIMLLYARVFRDGTVRRTARAMLAELPAPQQNSIVRLVDRQMIKGRIPLRSAFLQQGALQLYRMYCQPERCRECDIGVHVSFSPETA